MRCLEKAGQQDWPHHKPQVELRYLASITKIEKQQRVIPSTNLWPPHSKCTHIHTYVLCEYEHTTHTHTKKSTISFLTQEILSELANFPKSKKLALFYGDLCLGKQARPLRATCIRGVTNGTCFSVLSCSFLHRMATKKLSGM